MLHRSPAPAGGRMSSSSSFSSSDEPKRNNDSLSVEKEKLIHSSPHTNKLHAMEVGDASSIPSSPSSSSAQPPAVSSSASFLQRKLILPLYAVLKQGISPEGLALSFAFGIVCGLFPIPATTTLATLLAVALFQLNVAATQLMNLAMTPLNLGTFLYFIDCGNWMLGVQEENSASSILGMLSESPLLAIRTFGVSLLRGVFAWLIFSVIFTPILYLILRPLLRLAMSRVKREDA